MTKSTLIPLFPLALVVVPGQPVPLHIFEERYKEMIADCEGEDSYDVFGIVLASAEQVASIGCSVAVTEKGHRYPDGSFDIVGRAERRFTTIETFKNRSYRTAMVEFFDDDGDGSLDPALKAAVTDSYARLVELAKREKGIISQEDVSEELPLESGASLSFAITSYLGMDTQQKQQILEMRSENERLQFLVSSFDEMLPMLKMRLEQRIRVKSNGQHHGKES